MMTKVFKTDESKEKIRSRYQQILSAFPFGQRYVETAFGRTFLLEAGAPGSPPLVLLHGSCSNSAFWFPEISVLSGMFHVLAIDILGEAGNSDENRLDLHGDGYGDWLREVFQALSIQRAVVMGNSLGSWMALKLAIQYPDCVSKLILIAPAGLSQPNADILEQAKKAALEDDAAAAPSPSAAVGMELPKEVEEFINLIFWGYNPITEALPLFGDQQLQSLRMPVLFVAGKDDAMLDAVTAAQRLGGLVPHARGHLLENTGHMVPNALEYVLPFLAEPPAPVK